MAGGVGVGYGAPYPAIPETGILTALQQQFVRQLRRPLAGLAVMADKQTPLGRWFNEEVKWREVGELDDTVISIDFPPVQADSGTVTPRLDTSPMWTKDLVFGGRKWGQFRESGLDPVVTQERAWAMARDMNRHILLGSPAGKPGPTVGLLNHTGVGTTTGGNWANVTTGANQMNLDLGKAISAVLDRDHSGTFTLLHKPSDADVFNHFVNSQAVRIGNNLPGAITRVLMDDEVTAGEVFVINNEAGSYDWVHPVPEDGFRFGLGTVNMNLADPAGGLILNQEVEEENITKTRITRAWNIGFMRMVRTGTGDSGSPVQKVTFTRA